MGARGTVDCDDIEFPPGGDPLHKRLVWSVCKKVCQGKVDPELTHHRFHHSLDRVRRWYGGILLRFRTVQHGGLAVVEELGLSVVPAHVDHQLVGPADYNIHVVYDWQ